MALIQIGTRDRGVDLSNGIKYPLDQVSAKLVSLPPTGTSDNGSSGSGKGVGVVVSGLGMPLSERRNGISQNLSSGRMVP